MEDLPHVQLSRSSRRHQAELPASHHFRRGKNVLKQMQCAHFVKGDEANFVKTPSPPDRVEERAVESQNFLRFRIDLALLE